MSSKFSRRPRIQPLPGVCKKPRTPQPIPTPPPPWPAPTMIAGISWHQPWFPPPNWGVDATFPCTWIPVSNWYDGWSAPGIDRVQVTFSLDLITGAYVVVCKAWRGAVDILTASSYPAFTPPGLPFNITINDWIGIFPANSLLGIFVT